MIYLPTAPACDAILPLMVLQDTATSDKVDLYVGLEQTSKNEQSGCLQCISTMTASQWCALTVALQTVFRGAVLNWCIETGAQLDGGREKLAEELKNGVPAERIGLSFLCIRCKRVWKIEGRWARLRRQQAQEPALIQPLTKSPEINSSSNRSHLSTNHYAHNNKGVTRTSIVQARIYVQNL